MFISHYPSNILTLVKPDAYNTANKEMIPLCGNANYFTTQPITADYNNIKIF